MPEINNARQESIAQSVVSNARDSPVLLVLCGPSHAGKSTFAERLRSNFTIVSTDEVRQQLGVGFRRWQQESEVWEAYEATKCRALKSGQNVLLDACHMSRQARWHALQGPNEHHRKICVVFDVPWRTIRERCLKAGRMPLGEARRMWRVFQGSKPTPEELKRLGFDDVHFVRE